MSVQIKKREFRIHYLSHNPGLRTCLSSKDKQLRSPRRYEYNTPSLGNAYKHILGTSTIATSTTEDSKCSKFGL